MSDPRQAAPPCPFKPCRAQAGDRFCYTATGFPRHWHAARVRAAAGHDQAAARPAGHLAGRRPTDAQHRILSQAVADDGRYELSGYRFHGDAQRRSAMQSMSGPERGWFSPVGETPHGTLYKITEDGLAAWQRYETWMNGGS